MRAKESHRINLLEYLSNPENDFPRRCKYLEVLGISRNILYRHFSPLELSEIENEAVEIRRKSCSRQRENVLKSLYDRAIGYEFTTQVKIRKVRGEILVDEVTKFLPPDKASAQEYLDRTEGKVGEKLELTGKDGKELQPIINVTTTGNKHKSS